MQKIIPFHWLTLLALFFSATFGFSAPVQAQTEIREIAFPTDASQVHFRDDFGEPRYQHGHEGNDIMGKKMLPLYAAVDGRVSYLVLPEASWGYAITLEDEDGYTYHYLHINNDTPGTDDGQGGPEHAYAPGIEDRARVTKGQLIGWMGDSGNAESAGPHLHFEIRMPDGTPINPYQSLMAALNAKRFDPAAAAALSPDINTDKGLVAAATDAPPCESGSLIKPKAVTSVYYCGADGRRYVFTNDRAYFTWYADFKGVETISDEAMAAIPLGGNVTYRPGIKMIKIQSDPSVYAVEKGGTLRWMQSPAIAAASYGKDWAKQIDDVSDAFFFNYQIGEPVSS